ncbi:MAG: aldehyde ferredoxin oxidoreductase family protein [Actinobacteria bacterium]|nr:aldehyde ferredoxin oxidoreductase family protein [Actinomycetota bacterium]
MHLSRGIRFRDKGGIVDFYRGQVLRVDLSAGSVAVEPLNTEWAEKYVGGKGLLLRYLWQEVPPRVDPWAPDNPIILMTGPFAGTNVTTASRLVVGCKSPVTGIYNDSYVGGSFAPEIKFAGYDAIIITGQAAEPVVLTIADDTVDFVPAKPRYWGMRTSEIEMALRADFDRDAKVLSIGPAGEAEIPWACISTDQYHKAGRGGHGALMGCKGLKAIAVRGTGGVSVGDAQAFLADVLRMHTEYILTEDNLWANEEGTPFLAQVMSDAGVMPTLNWSTGSFDGIESINSDAMQKIKTKNRACYQCALGCRQWHDVGSVAGEGPEYETIAICGANCGIDDLEALLEFNHECDELGLDTISCGTVVALAMDLAAKGVKDFGLRFGQREGYVNAPELIVQRKGVGADLALGARALAAKYGRPDLAFEVKNLELPGYDPRGSFGMSLAYSTSDRGGCHMRSFPIVEEVVDGTLPPDSLQGKAEYNVVKQNFSSMKFSGIWCDFWAMDLNQIAQLMKHVWRREVSEEELAVVGERIWNVGRLFNLREGVEPDDLPVRLYAAEYAHTTGASAGRAIGSEVFREASAEYYRLRGWDDRGVPSEAKLTELGVDVRLPSVATIDLRER